MNKAVNKSTNPGRNGEDGAATGDANELYAEEEKSNERCCLMKLA